MTIIGIDPGTTQIGYGVIEKRGSKYKHRESKTIKVTSKNTKERLKELEDKMSNIVENINPDKIGVEKIFFSKNRKTAIKVAQARGVILLTLSKTSVPLFEISPSEVKSSVTGDGNASKDAVAKMVGHFLNIDTESLGPDTTDALAIAIAASTK